MNRIPRVACINDISGFGRCSLTIAIPILSVAGVQACPLPTAVLSKHTGFENYFFADLTEQLPMYIKDWSGISFDGIYSGFLGSANQIELVENFIISEKIKNTDKKIIIDTVMGDAGKMYSTYTEEMCLLMKRLISHADVITPNITEACILTNTDYTGEDIPIDKAKNLILKIADIGCNCIVITGIMDKGDIVNLSFENGNFFINKVHRTEQVFSGTGDLFASIITAFLMKGKSLHECVEIASDFISAVTQYTLKIGSPINEGVVFEPLLCKLSNK